MPEPAHPEAGQASVELVALLPVLAVLAAVLWQGVLYGQTAWAAAAAARAAARAHAVGGDAERAAGRALTHGHRARVRVRSLDDGAVEVRLRVPSVLGDEPLATVATSARLEP